MTTKLDKPLKREIDVGGVLFTVTLSPAGIRVVEKGKRRGQELSWERIIRGDVALGQDLADSIELTME